MTQNPEVTVGTTQEFTVSFSREQVECLLVERAKNFLISAGHTVGQPKDVRFDSGRVQDSVTEVTLKFESYAERNLA